MGPTLDMIQVMVDRKEAVTGRADRASATSTA